MYRSLKDIRKIMFFTVAIIGIYNMIAVPFFGAQLSSSPKLVEAIGTAGQCGYLRNDDIDRFDGNVDNIPVLKDAVELSKSLEAPVRIPLYEKDGVTVIGSFTLI